MTRRLWPTTVPRSPGSVTPPTTGVRREHVAPLVVASEASLEGYGCLVDEPETFPIEIVRWPAQGWRPGVPWLMSNSARQAL